MANAELKFAVSSAAILDHNSKLMASTYGIGDHVRLATSTGNDGIQLWPQRLDPLWEMSNGVSPKYLPFILAAHQSPRAPIKSDLSRGIIPVLRNLEASVFLPEASKSLRSIDRLADQVMNSQGIELPVVLYEGAQDYLLNSRIKDKRIQVDPETSSAWGVTTATEYVKNALEKGFTSVVIDTHHLRRPNVYTGSENPMANWRKSIPELLPNVNEIHLGAGRIDYGDMDEKQIMDEFEDLITGGQRNTEVIQMLRLIADQGWKGLIVLELCPSAIKKRLGTFSERELAITYEAIRGTLFDIFEK